MFKAMVILFIHATSMESWEINTSTNILIQMQPWCDFNWQTTIDGIV